MDQVLLEELIKPKRRYKANGVPIVVDDNCSIYYSKDAMLKQVSLVLRYKTSHPNTEPTWNVEIKLLQWTKQP